MSEYSVELQEVSKTYRLYPSSGSRLKEAIHPFGKKYHSKFEALSNINLKIKRGETFSLIGRNGAGKSTVLKIIAGIVTPSSGKVTVNGKVIALLELGAGFNPEMSGDENVYLFGAFHGYTREQMSQKYKDIIDFSEIGDFINQPVKTYSSGMFVRLAFACSVHLDPDILIVDEALSVGDARFQAKCFKFIDELKKQGATIVLVSHDLSLIKMVSDRACLVEGGHILMIGPPKDVANMYFDLDMQKNKSMEVSTKVENKIIKKDEKTIEIIPGDIAFGQGVGLISRIEISTSGSMAIAEGDDELSFLVRGEWNLEKIDSIKKSGSYVDNIILGISMSDKYGNYIFGMTTCDKDKIFRIDRSKAEAIFRLKLPQLKTDDYLINASMALGTQEHHTQISWYEAIFTLKYRSSLKNVYGIMHPYYDVLESDKHE